MAAHRIRRLEALADAEARALAALLVDGAEGGASVSFMHPLSTGRALACWREVGDAAARGERALAQPENQPHRADLSKWLVHRRARRQGLGAEPMRAAEHAARDAGKTLLVLDTASAEAERPYARPGWQRVGTLPGHALRPQGGPCDTVCCYRTLRG